MIPASSHKTELRVQAVLSSLALIREFVLEGATYAGFNTNDSYTICMAVDEACSNIIRHGYKNDDSKSIRLTTTITAESMIICVYDTAEPFDPLEIQPTNMQEYLAAFRHGGLGVHIIQKVIDVVSYTPKSACNTENELHLLKLRT